MGKQFRTSYSNSKLELMLYGTFHTCEASSDINSNSLTNQKGLNQVDFQPKSTANKNWAM